MRALSMCLKMLHDFQDEELQVETPLPTPASLLSPSTPFFDFSKLDTIDQDNESSASKRRPRTPPAPGQGEVYILVDLPLLWRSPKSPP